MKNGADFLKRVLNISIEGNPNMVINTRKKLLYVTSLLLVFSSIFGCTMRRISEQELNKTHNLIIVPFRGTPAMIVANTSILSMIAPVIYIGVEKATRGSRQQVVSTLNDNFGKWEPSVVIAQECSSLIKQFQATKIRNITILKEMESHQSEELRKNDPGRFSAKERSIHKWISAGSKWIKSDNNSFYKQISESSNADWALEIFISTLSIFGDKTTISTPMKLTNIKSGEVITSIGSLGSEFNFNSSLKLEKISDFNLYINDFRNGAKETCSKILSKAGLINRVEQNININSK